MLKKQIWRQNYYTKTQFKTWCMITAKFPQLAPKNIFYVGKKHRRGQTPVVIWYQGKIPESFGFGLFFPKFPELVGSWQIIFLCREGFVSDPESLGWKFVILSQKVFLSRRKTLLIQDRRIRFHMIKTQNNFLFHLSTFFVGTIKKAHLLSKKRQPPSCTRKLRVVASLIAMNDRWSISIISINKRAQHWNTISVICHEICYARMNTFLRVEKWAIICLTGEKWQIFVRVGESPE